MSPLQKSRGLRLGHIELKSQCLLKMSAGFADPAMWMNRAMPDATASLSRCMDSMVWRLCGLAWGMEPVLTTAELNLGRFVFVINIF